ncbi:hypothetical protein COLO4_35203 [Corchorus olitorius]|uniref:Uncharacterized protein n=1 Tax=Corchorus olitorius TaxID=93759 RepID=A0A1R3GHV3_9ROSI|nr:hypothetical protein COLO4_35203 [Corchorus olitorius]
MAVPVNFPFLTVFLLPREFSGPRAQKIYGFDHG